MRSSLSLPIKNATRIAVFLGILSSTFLLLVNSLAYGQAPTWGRALSFGGSGTDGGDAVKVDRRGNKYVTGFFSGTATFGSRALTSSGGIDIFLVKYRSDGTQGWVVKAGGSNDDKVDDLAFDGNENVYLVGWFTDSATFDSVGGATRTVSGNGNTIFLAKYNPDGMLLWIQTGTAQFGVDQGYGVAANPATGVVYITGIAQGSVEFSSANGASNTVSGSEDWHMFLVKYDEVGNFQWGQLDEASPNSSGDAVAVDANDNAYVTGWFEGDATFTSRDGHSQVVHGMSGPVQTFPDYPGDAFIVKYNQHGDLQWIDDIGGYKAIGNDIAVTPDGEVSVTGIIGNINGNSTQVRTVVTSQPPGANINLGSGPLTFPFNSDVFVATFDTSGVAVGATRIGGPGTDVGGGIAYDAEGNLYLSGTFQGTVEVGGQTLSSSNPNNLFVLKYTGSVLDWAKVARGAGTQAPQGGPRIGVGSVTGKVFVTGQYAGSAFFGHTSVPSVGGEDIFFATIAASAP